VVLKLKGKYHGQREKVLVSIKSAAKIAKTSPNTPVMVPAVIVHVLVDENLSGK